MALGPHGRSFALHPGGCVIDVRLRAMSSPTVGFDVRGLLDTGASDVCIDYRTAEALGLPEIDAQLIGTAAGSVLARVFRGVLEAPALGFAEPMRLYALNARRLTHDILLGRAFMRHFIVTFDGPGQAVHFSAPVGLNASDEWDG